MTYQERHEALDQPMRSRADGMMELHDRSAAQPYARRSVSVHERRVNAGAAVNRFGHCDGGENALAAAGAKRGRSSPWRAGWQRSIFKVSERKQDGLRIVDAGWKNGFQEQELRNRAPQRA